MPNVLTINTYAGSLLLGARDAKVDVIASLEDSNFGTECQERNFGLVIHKETPWPDIDLSKTPVIAHPPCSAFSNMTLGSKNKGPSSDAFKCTVNVLEYAGRNGAESVAIESVIRAAEGAREIHESMAKKFGWNVFRIFQNAATFGVPQWRNRFWIVFSKKKELPFYYKPVIRRLKEVLEDDGGDDNPCFLRQTIILAKKGLNEIQISKTFNEPPWGHLRKSLNLEKNEVNDWMYTKFSVNQWIKLDPDGFCPVVIGSAQWIWKGKPLSLNNWKRCMGFPAEYWMPEKKTKSYLSKGVCPQVASWVIKIITQTHQEVSGSIKPGQSLDLRPGKGLLVKK